MKKAVAKTKAGKEQATLSEKRRKAGERTQFKPGQSGNPAGRPKGLLDFKTRLGFAITRYAEEFAAQHNTKHPKKQITPDDVDIMGDIFVQLINKARNGDLKAIDSLLDRTYGKATQPVELGGIQGNPLAEAQRKQAMAEVEAWERQWETLGVKSGNKKHGSDTVDKGAKAAGRK